MAKKKKIYFLHIAILGIIILFCIRYLNVNVIPKIFGDEYGYWAAGAYFSGFDWKSVTSLNEYYAWGYGTVLAVIIMIFKNMLLCYQVAVIVNGLFVFGSYLIAFKLVKELLCDWNMVCQSMLAFIVVAFPSNLYYTQYTLSEVPLCLLFWSTTYLVWKVLKNSTYLNELLLIFFSLLLFSVHMRTIAIVFINILTIAIIEIKKKRIKRFVFLAFVSVFLFCIIWGITLIYQNAYIPSYIVEGNNTISGQVSKINYFFSMKGIMSFIRIFLGRIYSLCTDTFFLGVLGYILIPIRIISVQKNEAHLDCKEYLSIIVSTELLLTMGISSLFVIGKEFSRIDVLTYSRYHSFAVGPLMLMAVVYSQEYFRKSFYKKVICIICFVSIIMAKFITYIQNFELSTSNLFINTPILYFWSQNTKRIEDIYLAAILAAIFFICVIQFLLAFKNKSYGIVVLFMMMALGIYQGHSIFEYGCLNWSRSQAEATFQSVEFIQGEKYEDRISFMVDDSIFFADQFQYLLCDYKIQTNTIDDLCSTHNIIVTTKKYKNSKELENAEFHIIYENNYIKIWENDIQKKENKN